MMRVASVLRAISVLAAIAAIALPSAARAECPPDCGAVGIKFIWFLGPTAEIRAGYDSQALVPITYKDDRLASASLAVAAEFIQPLRLRALAAGDVASILGRSRLEASINEAVTSRDMHDSRFKITGSQFVGIDLYGFEPYYGARFSLDAERRFGVLDVKFPLLGINYDGTNDRTYTYGLVPELRLFGENTPGLCGEVLGESCFTFGRGEYEFRPVGGIPEPGGWALLIVGAFAAGLALRRAPVRNLGGRS